MADLAEAVRYIVEEYPHKDELSNARVTKMLYLADWFAVINQKERVTDIRWYFDNYGPFVWDVRRAVSESKELKVNSTFTQFGAPKEVFETSNVHAAAPKLTRDEVEALNHVIDQTKNLSWSSFIKLVYSTYPVASSEKYSYLNLESAAEDYRPAGKGF